MKLKITVHGVAYEVEVEVLDPGEGFPSLAPLPNVQTAQPKARTAPPASASPGPAAAPAASPPPAAGGGASDSAVASPIAGTVVEVNAKAGDTVSQGDVLLVIEAMKMNTSIAAPGAGRIRTVDVAAGDTVREGQTLVTFE